LPPGTIAMLDAGAWILPPVFAWLARTGEVTVEEMLRVFNCGVGMTLIVSDAEAATKVLREAGEQPFLLGHVSDKPGIVIEGTEKLFA
ncbi:MAG: AIR synthase-related protein, partial [Acidocella sp.]|nr:AIR synthase-related protein [Acidocella sp.]